MKLFDYICFGIWIFLAIFGVVAAVVGIPISHVSFICATVICILHYAERIWG